MKKLWSKCTCKARVRFTRWYYKAGFEAEHCPWWLRLPAAALLNLSLYVFMANKTVIREYLPRAPKQQRQTLIWLLEKMMG